MSGFSAVEAVEALDYTFEPFVDLKGTIPEPTDELTEAFFATVNKYRSMTPAELESLGSESLDIARKAIADLSAGTLTLEDLKKVPPRVFGLFFQYILKELTDPKG